MVEQVIEQVIVVWATVAIFGVVFRLLNCDCVSGAHDHLKDRTLDLLICDPPFGIEETAFEGLYNRKAENVLPGYVEAPDDYQHWTTQWLLQSRRVLKDNGAMYLVSGWTRLREVLNAVHAADFHVVNILGWQYNFGVYTKNKYVTSHYHILYLSKAAKAATYFNRFCRYATTREQYADMQDVWYIKREFHPGKKKNTNKLPDALVEKMIQYSSKPGDWIGDFFLGNFTTAYVGARLQRNVVGFEINGEAYEYHLDQLQHCYGRYRMTSKGGLIYGSAFVTN
jgi:site-specific DNA-methyltransferase (adenine-specific)